MNKKHSFPIFPWKDLKESHVIGVDEVGRGCLAGPVYAAAVILNPRLETQNFVDSKTIKPTQREVLASLVERDHRVGLGFATVQEIETLNILKASLLAMKRAVEALGVDEGHILVDGKFCIPDLKDFKQTPLIKGDQRATPIAAASIVAKVTRDRLMGELDKDFPQYGFKRHKGYSTKIHKEAIQKWGPCAHHRKAFAGVKEFLPSTRPGV